MGHFTREDCEFTKFSMESRGITFDEERDILVSVPFSEDTPQRLKDELNGILLQSMDEAAGAMGGHMPRPCELSLEARMQVSYGWESGVQYYISVIIIGFESETWIEKDVPVSPASEIHSEWVSYCRGKLDGILFPTC